jgi:uncharacterized protein (UPF0210 family)
MVTRNSLATGDLALPMGIWHFAVQSHIDVKRIYTRLGHCVSDTTVRGALNSMTESSLTKLKTTVTESISQKQISHCIVLDNVQQYQTVSEQGLNRTSKLKVGTAATAVKLHPYAPGAFDLKDYLDRVRRNGPKLPPFAQICCPTTAASNFNHVTSGSTRSCAGFSFCTW